MKPLKYLSNNWPLIVGVALSYVLMASFGGLMAAVVWQTLQDK
jgi:hypothetical protein